MATAIATGTGEWLAGSWRRAAAVVLGLMLAAYLLYPALIPAHPEGFTAVVASLGRHLVADSLNNLDTIDPLNVEYFGLTKLGWVLGTGALVGLFEISGSEALRLQMWLGSIAFAFGTLFLARKWTAAPLPLLAIGLLLIPGAVESAFLFNDNMVSTGLALLGLCVLYLRADWLAWILSGALLALAVLTRTDTALIGAVVPLLLWERYRNWRRLAIAGSVIGATGAALLFGALGLFDASPFDLLKVGGAAVEAWNREPGAARPLVIFLYFLGLPAILLGACGLFRLIEERRLFELLRLLIVPVLFLAVLGSKLWEIRQFLPLTPFLLSLAIAGVRGIFPGDGSTTAKMVKGAVMATVAVSLFAPAVGAAVADGPRVMLGRVASVGLWRDWQKQVEADFELLNRLIAQAPAGRPAVLIADKWNEDRYLHMLLNDRGFARAPPAAACAPVTERYVGGNKDIYLIRLQQTFVSYWSQIHSERWKRFVRPCLKTLSPGQVHFIGAEERVRWISAFARAPEGTIPDAATMFSLEDSPLTYGRLVAVPVTSQSEAEFSAGLTRTAQLSIETVKQTYSIDDGARTTRKRVRFPGKH